MSAVADNIQTEMPMPLVFTDSAAAKVADLIAEEGNPDLKLRQTPEGVANLNLTQAAILAAAAPLLKVGGRLVYATCSLLPSENEAIVEAFLAANPHFALLPANALLAEQRVEVDTGDYLRLTPALHNTDGFFAAALTRVA